MRTQKKPSFFQRLTGNYHIDDDAMNRMEEANKKTFRNISVQSDEDEEEYEEVYEEEAIEESEVGQLAIDVFETPLDIIVQTMIPGVKKEDMEISLSRDMLTIRGERRNEKTISENNYHYKELYFGSFARSIRLPHEVDIDRAEATEIQGMLTLKLPRVDKERQTKLKLRA